MQYKVNGFIVEAPGCPRLIQWRGSLDKTPDVAELIPDANVKAKDGLKHLLFEVSSAAVSAKAMMNVAYRQQPNAFSVGDIFLWIDARPSAPDLHVVG